MVVVHQEVAEQDLSTQSSERGSVEIRVDAKRLVGGRGCCFVSDLF